MARTKNARGQNPANFEQGSSSRHPQPPNTANVPDSGNLVPVSANPTTEYPFHARMRMTNAMRDREAKLRSFTVIDPIYPDCELLENLRLLDELKEYFDESGFGFVFMDEPPHVFEELVREFVYSFRPEWRVIPKERSSYNMVEKHVVSWKFRLGGVEYTYSRQDLIRALKTEDYTSYPYVGKKELNDFWKMITCAEQNFAPAEHSTKIVLPLWRLVHRFIATCVILRKDEGRWVTKTDLELMCCLYDSTDFDPLIYITRSLEESTTPTFRGSYIGGGPFVTMIAMDAGYELDPKWALPRKRLREAEMVRRGFLKLKRDYRGTHRLVVGRDIGAAGRDERPPQPAPSFDPPTQDIPSSSSAPRPITLESLSAQVDTLATSFQHFSTYAHDHFRWEGDTFRDLYTRMGYDGFVPPPQYDMAGPSGTAGDMDAEDDEDDEEATASESENDDTNGSEED